MGLRPAIQGQLRPIRDKVLVYNMNFGEEKTKGGIVLPGQDGKVEGIKPRWAQVYAVGPEQKDIEEGEWILIEHGRWTRKFLVASENGNIPVHGVDNNAILMASDERPSENLNHRYD